MSTNETDILIDNLSETIFPYLTELNNTNEMDDSALHTALAEEFDLNCYIAHKHRIKTLQTFIKEIL